MTKSQFQIKSQCQNVKIGHWDLWHLPRTNLSANWIIPARNEPRGGFALCRWIDGWLTPRLVRGLLDI